MQLWLLGNEWGIYTSLRQVKSNNINKLIGLFFMELIENRIVADTSGHHVFPYLSPYETF